jgi:hypothetical protein
MDGAAEADATAQATIGADDAGWVEVAAAFEVAEDERKLDSTSADAAVASEGISGAAIEVLTMESNDGNASSFSSSGEASVVNSKAAASFRVSRLRSRNGRAGAAEAESSFED